MEIVGTREGGGEVAVESGVMYLLTECCNASGKGSIALGEMQVVCRNCYNEVSDDYGDAADTRDPAHVQAFIDRYQITLYRKETEMSDTTAMPATEVNALRVAETETRKNLKMSRRQLAEELGWTESRVWYLEQESMDHEAVRNQADLKIMKSTVDELTLQGWKRPTVASPRMVLGEDTKAIVGQAVAEAVKATTQKFAEDLGVISDIVALRMDEAKAKKASTKPFQTILDAISALQWSEG